MIEYANSITRVYATVIPGKKSETLIPIICRQVASNSVIWTDKHRSYNCLCNFNFFYAIVCHRYEFINTLNGVNTQAAESFNSFIKYELKMKNMKTTDRGIFL
ncbi:hypothetical protein COBT_002911 [Conglomerata obtusa]